MQQLGKRHHRAAKGLRHSLCACLRAIGDRDSSRALGEQVPRGQLPHLACADQQDALAGERPEDFQRKVDGNARDRYRTGADRGFGPHPLGNRECRLEQAVELAPGGTRNSRRLVRSLDLSEDLRLADHHGIQAGRDPEQVAHRLGPVVLVQVRAQLGRAYRAVRQQVLPQVRSCSVMGDQELNPVAGGQDHRLAHVRPRLEGAERRGQIVRRDGNLLAQLHRRIAMVQAREKEIHGAENLCTELSRFAAHTLSTTRKATEDT